MTSSERLIADLNADIFFREFSFADTRFASYGETEKELADHVIWVDDLVVIFQIKERFGGTASDESWFKREVLNKGTRQIRDTLQYIREAPEVLNQRGHRVSTASWESLQIVKVVLYFCPTPPPNIRSHHVSRSAGFIHLVDGNQYIDLCSILRTPSEILRYFEYRERRCLKGSMGKVSERATLGQWLVGDFEAEPDEEYASAIDQLVPPSEDAGISFLTTDLVNHLYTCVSTDGPAPDYYRVLAELAKLDRVELAAFRARFDLARAASREDRFERPWRIIPGSGCAFLILAVVSGMFQERVSAIEKFTMASKYELRLNRHVGVGVAVREKQLYVDWLWLDGEWGHDESLERALNGPWKPFRPLKEEKVLVYSFEP